MYYYIRFIIVYFCINHLQFLVLAHNIFSWNGHFQGEKNTASHRMLGKLIVVPHINTTCNESKRDVIWMYNSTNQSKLIITATIMLAKCCHKFAKCGSGCSNSKVRVPNLTPVVININVLYQFVCISLISATIGCVIQSYFCSANSIICT
jgi:hypothetical protein